MSLHTQSRIYHATLSCICQQEGEALSMHSLMRHTKLFSNLNKGSQLVDIIDQLALMYNSCDAATVVTVWAYSIIVYANPSSQNAILKRLDISIVCQTADVTFKIVLHGEKTYVALMQINPNRHQEFTSERAKR